MGKWKREYLIVDPGDRDVDAVAGDLRASLASVDIDGVAHPERSVTVEDGRVHWDSGEVYRNIQGRLEAIADSLDVPCAWAVTITQHEVDSTGSAALFVWADGGLRLVESSPRASYLRGSDGVWYLGKAWGIEGDARCSWTGSNRADGRSRASQSWRR
ncbi:hypothetical protein GJ629_06395 [Halapricum sp. CBA1109]|uniref:hypothetical protein n=1 Tax=Halapricum sp. CBA1109 TaxID=2668068 RepID=UPI0012FBF794|nr:hypothetical protein [Halapricum sp. CBA1109]MUV89570.1 hypothetical protein [Halapricum sp. CBA1109]